MRRATRERNKIYTLDQVLKGPVNPLAAKFCGCYTPYNKEEYAVFCSEYISDERTPEHTLEIKLRKTEQYHCGYCSDNDGSITEEVSEESVFFKLPDGFSLKKCKSLFQDFYLETCYCGGNNISFSVVDIN